MYSKLILFLFIISTPTWAQISAHEELFSKSRAWLKLLHYEKKWSGPKSTATRALFFLSEQGATNPLLELNQSLTLFKENPRLGCKFPARYHLLSKNFNLPEAPKCNEFQEFTENINAGDLYLVYSSAYPSNPASMFGHTFLRLDRKKTTHDKNIKKLLGYSIAFQAQIDKRDNSLVYTFKGMTGGYQSYLEIKPHYMDVGIYNNSESRDLWEYKIPLSEEEKYMLIAHTWEIMRTTTFNYYFLDENCSTSILEFLEAIKPEWDFKSKNHLFVIPQVTLKEVISKTQINTPGFRPAIKRSIWKRIEGLNSKALSRVFDAKENYEQIEKITSAEELDLLIDLWKLDNYKKTTILSSNDRKKMNQVLIKRSELDAESKTHNLEEENLPRAPHLAHDYKRLSFYWDEDPMLAYRYGFHSFSDPILGHDEKSFVEAFEPVLRYSEKELRLERIKLIEILSLQNFSWHYPHISWNIDFEFVQAKKNNKTPKVFRGSGGVGFSIFKNKFQSFFLLNFLTQKDSGSGGSFIAPQIKLGLKYLFNNRLEYILEAESKKLGSQIQSFLSSSVNFQTHSQGQWTVGLKSRENLKEYKAFTKLSIYF